MIHDLSAANLQQVTVVTNGYLLHNIVQKPVFFCSNELLTWKRQDTWLIRGEDLVRYSNPVQKRVWKNTDQE